MPVVFFLFLFSLRCLFLRDDFNLKDGQLVRVIGSLSQEPFYYNSRQKLIIGQFEVWVNRYPEYSYGDRLEITGKVKVQAPPLSFNFPLTSSKYLIDMGTTGITSTTGITGGSGIMKMAIGLRQRMREVFEKSLPSPLDGLIAGIVLGDKTLIPEDFWQKLKEVGILHLMVASGSNVSFFSTAVLGFLLLIFSRKIATLFVVSLIWLYSIVTGLNLPILRACVMLSLGILSQISGREESAKKFLLLTVAIMLLLNPSWLFDLSFQLSFSATAGLVFLQPKIEKWGRHKGWRRIFRNEALSMTLAAEFSTLPLLVTSFGQFNLASPLVNLLILWVIPYILGAGLVLGVLGTIFLPLAKIGLLMLYPLLFYLEQTVNLFAKIKILQVSIPKVNWIFTVFFLYLVGILD
ncbi:MAG: ComEC/Rec2 family competence protein [Patescibacteria group bacterium]|nr:ComEC/Rec2 family competence protein [Patescibacteria group bacterium]